MSEVTVDVALDCPLCFKCHSLPVSLLVGQICIMANMSIVDCEAIGSSFGWKKDKDPHPQDKSQHLDFTKDAGCFTTRPSLCILPQKCPQ